MTTEHHGGAMYDYVIVGAGSAGCVLAARLSEDPAARVLLLEAGPPDRRRAIRIPAAPPKLFGSEIDWAFRTEPEPALNGRTVFVPRGRTLGGSSSINFQMYLRGHREDFDEWARLGAHGWSFDDALPYFERAEGQLTLSDQRDPNPITRALVEAATEAGIEATDDLNATGEGVAIVRVTQRSGRRWSCADAYLRPALRRPNLDLRTDARVVGVVTREGRATGVEYVLDGRRDVAWAREVILAAGAFGSPQLLMLSGIGPAEHLRRHGIQVVCDLPGVGQNLHDHVAVPVLYRSSRPVSLYAAESPRQLARYVLRRRGLLTSNVGEAAAFVRSRPELAAPDLEVLFGPVLFWREALEPPPEHGFTLGPVVLKPASRGQLALRSGDPMAAPAIRPRYLTDDGGEDLATLMRGVRLARTIAARPAADAYRAAELEPGPERRTDAELEDWIRLRAQTIYHPAGTCRMGTDDLAVVDPDLRVRGLEGLRVIDASVMPSPIRGHTNGPTVMIGERGADLVRGRIASTAEGAATATVA